MSVCEFRLLKKHFKVANDLSGIFITVGQGMIYQVATVTTPAHTTNGTTPGDGAGTRQMRNPRGRDEWYDPRGWHRCATPEDAMNSATPGVGTSLWRGPHTWNVSQLN